MQFFSQVLLNIQKGIGPWAFVLGPQLCSPSCTDKVWEIPAAKVPGPPSLSMKKVPLVVGDTQRYPGWIRRKVRVTFISCISLCHHIRVLWALKEECKYDSLMVSHPGNTWPRTFLSSSSKEDKAALSSTTTVSAGIAVVWTWASMSQRAIYTTCYLCHRHHWYSWVSGEGEASLAWGTYESIISCSSPGE